MADLPDPIARRFCLDGVVEEPFQRLLQAAGFKTYQPVFRSTVRWGRRELAQALFEFNREAPTLLALHLSYDAPDDPPVYVVPNWAAGDHPRHKQQITEASALETLPHWSIEGHRFGDSSDDWFSVYLYDFNNGRESQAFVQVRSDKMNIDDASDTDPLRYARWLEP
jgi:hypothetical protein